ncbi:MAG: NADH-quinone oxidoreductase subunit C [Propionibacteriaceae bacterium]|jgi:NADH-quinone oxidoreductase subunit C|nr:NADH-quinone oxidoreductase subunit C [Propionibacteriaceae bacterium]
MTQPPTESGVALATSPSTPQAPITVKRGMWGSGPSDVSGYNGLVTPVYAPGPAQRPYGGWFDEVADRLESLVDAITDENIVIDRDEMTVNVPREHLLEVVQQCRDDAWLRFEMCVSVSGVHYPDQAGSELHVALHLLSMTHNRRLRLEVTCPESDPHVPSVVSVYPMADWHERETWDMFGVIFDGHPHLTRILMPDDWIGHPQRKDYPLGGVPIEFKGAQVPPPDERRSY